MNNQQMTLIQQMRIIEKWTIDNGGMREDYVEAKRKLFINEIMFQEAKDICSYNICARKWF